MLVGPFAKKKIRKMIDQINAICNEILTIFAGSNIVTNLAFIIDPKPTASAPAPK